MAFMATGLLAGSCHGPLMVCLLFSMRLEYSALVLVVLIEQSRFTN